MLCGQQTNGPNPVARKRKKKIVRVIHQSVGPLPLRLAGRFVGHRLLFTDASRQRHGGLAAVLFDDPDSPPLIATRQVPPFGSNELELLASLFGLEFAQKNHPDQAIALFSDNRDAVDRLNRAKTEGLTDDPALASLLLAAGLAAIPALTSIHWIPGHSSCRGNTLADRHAREAAGQLGLPA